MTELILKDHLELQKRLSDRADWEKIGNLQEAHSVLRTRFEAQISRFEEAQGRAVSQEDIKTLRREMEDQMKEAIFGVRQDIDKSNEQWADKILTGARALNAEAQVQRMEEQKQFGRQIAMTIFAAVLSVLGGLFVFWMTTRGH